MCFNGAFTDSMGTAGRFHKHPFERIQEQIPWLIPCVHNKCYQLDSLVAKFSFCKNKIPVPGTLSESPGNFKNFRFSGPTLGSNSVILGWRLCLFIIRRRKKKNPQVILTLSQCGNQCSRRYNWLIPISSCLYTPQSLSVRSEDVLPWRPKHSISLSRQPLEEVSKSARVCGLAKYSANSSHACTTFLTRGHLHTSPNHYLSSIIP